MSIQSYKGLQNPRKNLCFIEELPPRPRECSPGKEHLHFCAHECNWKWYFHHHHPILAISSSIYQTTIIFELLNMLNTVDASEHPDLSVITFTNLTVILIRSTISISWWTWSIYNIVRNLFGCVVSARVNLLMLIISVGVFFALMLSSFFGLLKNKSSDIKAAHADDVRQFFYLWQVKSLPIFVLFY